MEELDIILTTLYNLVIVVIALIYLYAALSVKIGFISGLLLNLLCVILMLFFRSYSLFYTSLIVIISISYRYYHKKKNRLNSGELMHTFVFNLINICISTYSLFQMIYYSNPTLFNKDFIPLIRVSLITTAPVTYMIMIYSVTIILILSINIYLSANNKDTPQLVIIKTAAALIIIVLLIIIVNAAVYFIIHNYPLRQSNSIFDGNFLKDPIKSFYRSAKPFSDCLWFSATTFFTVGYGDMHPVGNIMYLLSTLQMLSAFVIGIIMIPILLFRLPVKADY